MNHYINLLEPAEIRYNSNTGIPPVFKLVGVGVLVLVVGSLGMKYQGLRRTAEEGRRIQSTWDRIEEDVEAAKALNTKSIRLEKARQTLEGWPASRHDWPDMLEYLVAQSPVPVEDLQFTHFSFDERMTGMRTQNPGPSAAKFHPLKRTVVLTLRGLIRSDSPQRMLPEYRRNLAEAESPPSGVANVNLETPVILMDAEGKPTGISEFTLQIELADREVTP